MGVLTTMTPEDELVEKWIERVFRPNEREVRTFTHEFPRRRHFAVDYEQCSPDYRFTTPLLRTPDAALSAGRRALEQFVADELGARAFDGEQRPYLRVYNLPDHAHVTPGRVCADRLNTLVATTGTVESVGASYPLLVKGAFRCERCGEFTRREPRSETTVHELPRCGSCAAIGFTTLVPAESEFVDAREIDLVDDERRLPVRLEHDLIDAVEPGAHVEIVAIPRARPNGESRSFAIGADAVSVSRLDATDPSDGE